ETTLVDDDRLSEETAALADDDARLATGERNLKETARVGDERRVARRRGCLQLGSIGKGELRGEIHRATVDEGLLTCRVEEHPMVADPGDLQLAGGIAKRSLDGRENPPAGRGVDAVELAHVLR